MSVGGYFSPGYRPLESRCLSMLMIKLRNTPNTSLSISHNARDLHEYLLIDEVPPIGGILCFWSDQYSTGLQMPVTIASV